MEGIALLGVFIAVALLSHWLVVHDAAPDGKTHGLFALREHRDVRENRTLSVNRRDPRVAPEAAQPVIPFTPPSRKQN
jgi:hypothetical protein